MNFGARHAVWIPVSDAIEDSSNDDATAAMIMKQSAIFIDDGDVHRLMRLLRNADGTGQWELVLFYQLYFNFQTI